MLHNLELVLRPCRLGDTAYINELRRGLGYEKPFSLRDKEGELVGRCLVASVIGLNSHEEFGGYIHLLPWGDGKGLQINELAVHSSWRRQGVGTALLEAAIEGLQGRLRILCVDVPEENLGMQLFLRDFHRDRGGFRSVGVNRDAGQYRMVYHADRALYSSRIRRLLNGGDCSDLLPAPPSPPE